MLRPWLAANTTVAALFFALTACSSSDLGAPNASKDNDANAGADGSEVDSATGNAADVADDVGVGAATDGEVLDAGNASADAGPVPCKSDKDCLAIDLVCNKAKALCVACNADADCAAEFSCKANVCVPPPTSCGSSKDCAALGQICDSAQGVCVDCVGDDDCAATQVCFQTVCTDLVCQPGTSSCVDGNTVRTCQASGLGYVTKACGSDQTCSDGGCGPSSSQVCAPGSKVCDGNKLRTCKADGSGYDESACPAKTLCASKGGVTACEAVTCAPGSLLCVGATIVECGAGGEPGQVSDDCGAKGKACADGACVDKPTPLCTAGATQCLGAVVQTCDGAGAVWIAGADCAKAGKVCQSGACVDDPGANVCTPGAKQCVDGKSLGVCGADGKGYQPSACDDGNPCTDDSCAAGACKAGPGIDGIACASGDACVTGTCQAGTCQATKQKLWSKALVPGLLPGLVAHQGGFRALRSVSTSGPVTRLDFTWDAVEVGKLDLSLKPGSPVAMWADGSVVGNTASGGLAKLERFDAAGKLMWSFQPSGVQSFFVLSLQARDDGSLLLLSAQAKSASEVLIAYVLAADGKVVMERELDAKKDGWNTGQGVITASVDGGATILAGKGLAYALTPAFKIAAKLTIDTSCRLLGAWKAKGDMVVCGETPLDSPRMLYRIDSDAETLVLDRKLPGSVQVATLGLDAGSALWTVVATNGYKLLAIHANGTTSLVDYPSSATSGLTSKSIRMLRAAPGGMLVAVSGVADVARVDAFGHVSCAASGACVNLSLDACASSDPCVVGWCAAAGGCSKTAVPDGIGCGDGKVCNAAKCGG